jgi:hypothetical protein
VTEVDAWLEMREMSARSARYLEKRARASLAGSARMKLSVLPIAVACVALLCACGSTSSNSSEARTDSASTAAGPCTLGDQDGCNACVFKAARSCNVDVCAREHAALEACVAEDRLCAGTSGKTNDNCCSAEGYDLMLCWAVCPAVLDCD